jgi:hypothetical protein
VPHGPWLLVAIIGVLLWRRHSWHRHDHQHSHSQHSHSAPPPFG